jgi:hypothetical protein
MMTFYPSAEQFQDWKVQEDHYEDGDAKPTDHEEVFLSALVEEGLRRHHPLCLLRHPIPCNNIAPNYAARIHACYLK